MNFVKNKNNIWFVESYRLRIVVSCCVNDLLLLCFTFALFYSTLFFLYSFVLILFCFSSAGLSGLAFLCLLAKWKCITLQIRSWFQWFVPSWFTILHNIHSDFLCKKSFYTFFKHYHPASPPRFFNYFEPSSDYCYQP